MIKRLAITAGEPAGIGPDIIVKAAAQGLPARCVVLGDVDVLAARAHQLRIPLRLQAITSIEQADRVKDALSVLSIPVAVDVVPGELNPKNSAHVIELLTQAAQLALRGDVNAIVTAPVNKAVINQAGIGFSGHTEFFASITNAPRVVMMLAYEKFRVALATTHCPLAQVPKLITPDLLNDTLTILFHDLKTKFGISTPRVLVCGLNPHAGEGGYLGREEIDVISPVIQDWKRRGFNIEGPLPADTAFTPDHIRHSDAILAMYHDQGLPTLKYAGFHHSVNITLGLPFIRTSVDHGTACDLAGTGRAQHDSLLAAVQLASSL